MVHGEDDHPHAREVPGDARQSLQAIEAGHGNIHQHHIRLVRFDQVKDLAAITGLTRDSTPGSFSSSARMPARTSVWSSASRTRMGLVEGFNLRKCSYSSDQDWGMRPL